MSDDEPVNLSISPSHSSMSSSYLLSSHQNITTDIPDLSYSPSPSPSSSSLLSSQQNTTTSAIPDLSEGVFFVSDLSLQDRASLCGILACLLSPNLAEEKGGEIYKQKGEERIITFNEKFMVEFCDYCSIPEESEKLIPLLSHKTRSAPFFSSLDPSWAHPQSFGICRVVLILLNFGLARWAYYDARLRTSLCNFMKEMHTSSLWLGQLESFYLTSLRDEDQEDSKRQEEEEEDNSWVPTKSHIPSSSSLPSSSSSRGRTVNKSMLYGGGALIGGAILVGATMGLAVPGALAILGAGVSLGAIKGRGNEGDDEKSHGFDTSYQGCLEEYNVNNDISSSIDPFFFLHLPFRSSPSSIHSSVLSKGNIGRKKKVEYHMHAIICVAGLLDGGIQKEEDETGKEEKGENDEFASLWEWVETRACYSDVFSLAWSRIALLDLEHSVQSLAQSELSSFGLMQQMKSNGISLSSNRHSTTHSTCKCGYCGFSWPHSVLKLSSAIDKTWDNAISQAEIAGKILADSLFRRFQGKRSISLIGFSVGAAVVFFSLIELHKLSSNASSSSSFFSRFKNVRGKGDKINKKRKQHETNNKDMKNESDVEIFINATEGMIQDVYLLGAPIMLDKELWKIARSTVAGRIVNGFSANDWTLRFACRSHDTSLNTSTSCGLCGLQSVDEEIVKGIENFDLSHIVRDHGTYKLALPALLSFVGFQG